MIGRRRDENGASAVELALLLPFLLLMLTGVVDFGMAIAIRAQMQEAAEEGITVAAHDPSNPTLAQQRAVDAVSMKTLATSDVDITCQLSNRRVKVTIDYQHNTIFAPIYFDDSLDIHVEMVSDVLSDDDCSPSP